MSKGYNFPESSDIEDEEVYDFSDIEMDEKNSSLSDDGISIEGSPYKATQSSLDPIDLTRDDSPESSYVRGVYLRARQVDLITPPPPGQSSTGQPPLGHFQVPVAIASQNEPIILETDEEGGFSTDSDDRSELGLSESLDSSRDYCCADDIEAATDDNGDLLKMNDESANISSPKSHIDSVIDNNEASEDDDSDSDLCLSEAGREGIRALFEDGLLGKDDGNYDLKSTEFSHSGANVEPLQHASFSSLEKTFPGKMSFDHFIEHREPSPSDAAMVKPAAITRLTVNQVNIDHTSSKEWFETTSQTLGDKTGKHEFFEARSYNKAKVSQGGIDDSTRHSNLIPKIYDDTEVTISESTYHEPKPLRVFATPRGSWARRSRTPRDTPDIALGPGIVRLSTATPLPYLDNHAQAPPLMDRDPSPEPDLTSAVKYNESKIKMDAANKIAANFSGRSRLSINDIIDGSSIDSAKNSQSLKRKAENISIDNTDMKNRASTSPSRDGPSAESPAENLQATITMTTPHQASDSAINATSDELEVARPSKRLKTFVQRLSYAALGGAAVGGALLSVLVATAPDYL